MTVKGVDKNWTPSHRIFRNTGAPPIPYAVFFDSVGPWQADGQDISLQDAMRGARDTAANIASIAAAINTTGKWDGKPVYDTTNKRYYYAIGADPASPWRPFADHSGAGDIVPA